LSVGCDRAAVNFSFQDAVEKNDLSRSETACFDMKAVVKLCDGNLTAAGLKTIGRNAAVSLFLSRMQSSI